MEHILWVLRCFAPRGTACLCSNQKKKRGSKKEPRDQIKIPRNRYKKQSRSKKARPTRIFRSVHIKRAAPCVWSRPHILFRKEREIPISFGSEPLCCDYITAPLSPPRSICLPQRSLSTGPTPRPYDEARNPFQHSPLRLLIKLFQLVTRWVVFASILSVGQIRRLYTAYCNSGGDTRDVLD